MREGKPGGGKGPLLSENESLTLAQGNGQVLFQPAPDITATPAPEATAPTDYSIAATLNSGGNDGGFRTEPGEHLALGPSPDAGRVRAPDGLAGRVDAYLPAGLDSARYRCCGNGVVSDVAFWLGERLRAAIDA